LYTVADRRVTARAFVGTALGLSLVFLASRDIPMPDNNTQHRVMPGVGYALWIASILAAFAGAEVAARSRSPSCRDATVASRPPRD